MLEKLLVNKSMRDLYFEAGKKPSMPVERISKKEAKDIEKTLTPLLKKYSKRFELAGSIRRGKSDAGDVDFILSNGDIKKIHEELHKYYTIIQVLRQGKSLASFLIDYNGKTFQLEFTNVPDESFGAGLLHVTGSGQFNVALRAYAKGKGYTINQYGIFTISGKVRLGGKTEKEVFDVLGLKVIPPEMRSLNFWKIKDDFRRYGVEELDAGSKEAIAFYVIEITKWLEKMKLDPTPKDIRRFFHTKLGEVPESEIVDKLIIKILIG